MSRLQELRLTYRDYGDRGETMWDSGLHAMPNKWLKGGLLLTILGISATAYAQIVVESESGNAFPTLPRSLQHLIPTPRKSAPVTNPRLSNASLMTPWRMTLIQPPRC